jgi:hypothetical protein
MDVDPDLEEEQQARAITGEEEKVLRNADDTWREIVRKILKTLLVAESDSVAKSKWQGICENRLEECVVNDKQLLQFAEELQREAKMFQWGIELFTQSAEKKEKRAHKTGYAAWLVFLRNCGDRNAWAEFLYRTKADSKDILPKIIARLRNEKLSLGNSVQELATVTVCPVKKAKKATKTTRLTTTKGNFAKTTEVQEPISDDEEAVKPAMKKMKKATKEGEEEEDDVPVNAVIPRKVQSEENFEMKRTMNDLSQMIRQQQQQLQQQQQEFQQKLTEKVQELAKIQQPTDERGRGRFNRRNYNDEDNRGYNDNYRRNRRRYNDYNNNNMDMNNNYVSSPNYYNNNSNKRNNNQNTPQLTFHNNTPQLTLVSNQQQQPHNNSSHAVLAVQNRVRGPCRSRPCLYPPCKFVHEPGQHKCAYRPCNSTRCTDSHEPGQHMPNENAMLMKGKFARMNRCKRAHDGDCTNQHCDRAHGKDNSNGPQCESMRSGDMCEAFFSSQGCLKSHRK